MKLTNTSEFLAWAAEHAIGRSPKYPRSPELHFLTPDSTWYRYRVSEAPILPSLAQLSSRVAAAGGGAWAFPAYRQGVWDPRFEQTFDFLEPLRAARRQADIPDGYVGAVHFEAAEVEAAGQFLKCGVLANGLWSLAIIPDHAQCLIRSDEDDDLIGDFPHEGACESFTEALRKAGWKEPEGPDPRVSLTDPWLEIMRENPGSESA